MTINPRAVRMLREARARMRDVAAAEHTVAQSDRDAAALHLAAEHDQLSVTLDGASAQLANARSVHDLGHVTALVDSHQDAITQASKSHSDASAAANQTATKLRDRARQLRTAERLVDMSDRMRAERDAKLEQRMTDDIGGRRR